MKTFNCKSCFHYSNVAERIGYCNVLVIALKDDVVIIMTNSLLNAVEKSLEADEVYPKPLVHETFRCSLYETLESDEYIN